MDPLLPFSKSGKRTHSYGIPSFYPPSVSVTGLEPNRAMHSYAYAKKPNDVELTISTQSAESLSFEVSATASSNSTHLFGTPWAECGNILSERCRCSNFSLQDNSFDVVVTTLTLCSVQDPHKVLLEAKRVLKSNGKFVFLEHVAAPDRSLLRVMQTLFNPLQRLLADNCHLNRQTKV